MQGQNLVPNPSFEQFIHCPNNENEVDSVIGWNSCGDSPDYFNSCDTNVPEFSVPNNWGGYQQAASGNAYCGIGVYGSCVVNVREFIGTQLTFPLNIGEKYFVSFKVSLSVSDLIKANTSVNKLGALFSTVNICFTSFYPPINNNANIYTDLIITDSLNWTTINGSFIADSAYKYITIGNFFDDAHTDTLIIKLDSFCQGAYYFIDDVYVGIDSLSNIQVYNTANTINISPNPTFNNFSIENNNTSKMTNCKIYNSIGSLVFEKKQIENKENIDVSDFLPGIYFLEMMMNEKMVMKKLIIY